MIQVDIIIICIVYVRVSIRDMGISDGKQTYRKNWDIAPMDRPAVKLVSATSTDYLCEETPAGFRRTSACIHSARAPRRIQTLPLPMEPGSRNKAATFRG